MDLGERRVSCADDGNGVGGELGSAIDCGEPATGLTGHAELVSLFLKGCAFLLNGTYSGSKARTT